MNVPGIVAFLAVVCSLMLVDAGPAYGSTNYNNWESTPQQQQQPTRRNSNQNQQSQGGKRTLQGMVRQHIDELDKQTQSDLKVLSYLEKELNQIFSCYIKLSCPRMRSTKVMAECDEIKDWPLYHQVMKMAGIRRYPYQNYAPTPSRRPITTVATTPSDNLPSLDLFNGRQEREMSNNDNGLEDTGATDDEIENDQYYQAATQRRPNNRRVRRDQHHH